MGTIDIDTSSKIITISSNIICYGNAADYEIAKLIAEEIETMWNEPNGVSELNNTTFVIRFSIHAQYNCLMHAGSIIENENPKNNYIRIEEYAKLNISCMDGIGSNTGYFQRNNLYAGSTTAAHEYGHSLGLAHPAELNITGKGRPGIMYPRGTLVDREFQYDINVKPGEGGGTLNPVHRKVMQADIDNLHLSNLIKNEIFIIGNFTNKYHEAHVKEDIKL